MVKRKKKLIIAMPIIFLLVIFALIISRSNKKLPKQQVAKMESNYTVTVGENQTQVNVKKAIAKTNEEVNKPKIGAGMIPIKKLTNGMYKIVAQTDESWYNYFGSEPAYMMLSDGYYKSEIAVGIKDSQLASNNIETIIDSEEKLGTIYVWMPRFTCTENQLEFLKGITTIQIDKWETPSIFTLEAIKDANIELTGIWLEVGSQNSESASQTKINKMNIEENIYGLIQNEKVNIITDEHRKYIQMYNSYHPLNIEDINSKNRNYINVINTNDTTELVVSSYLIGKTVTLNSIVDKNGIEKIIYERTGEILTGKEYVLRRAGGYYRFYVVDNNGNIITVEGGHEENPPDLTGFRVDSTYIVTYSGEINKGTATEYSYQPISEIFIKNNAEAPYVVSDENTLVQGTIDYGAIDEKRGKWYQYKDQKWANIVVKNNGNEAYFVWIPRYAYALNQENETTDVVFIDTDNINAKTEEPIDLSVYTIPEAFSWVNDKGETVPLSGFWISKYQLSSYVSFGLNPSVYSGINKIRIGSITCSSVSNATYKLTLMNSVGEEIANANYDGKSVYEFFNLSAGIYSVKVAVYDETGYYRGDQVIKNIEVFDPVIRIDQAPEEPDTTGFNLDTTFYVTYNEDGTEDSSIPLSQGIDKNKWYNYSEQRWANIVTRNNGNEAYYVWIPRYEYHAYNGYEYTDIHFIPVTQVEPSYACTIPEAFSWVNDKGETVPISGFWISKYQLSSSVSFGLTSNIYSGINKIRVKSITCSSVSNAKYKIYLIKDGVEIATTETTGGVYEFSENTTGKLDAGLYSVKVMVYDERNYYRGEHLYEDIEVFNPATNEEPEPPDLTGFNKSTTFYVTYNEDGTEDSSIPISQSAPSNWYNYSEQKWANIVTKNNGKEAYFVWIPRYEYHAYSGEEITDIHFIPTTQTTPSREDFTIPEAFSWVNDKGETVPISGFWISKYQLSN